MDQLQAFWEAVRPRLQEAVRLGERFYPRSKSWLLENKLSNAHFALGSRYLPRGPLCPSPDLECVITNMRRGRIAKRLTEKSVPTNYYMFDREGRLYYAETFYPDFSKKREYILREGEWVYGFVYDQFGTLEEISIEGYEEGRLKCYTWAACSRGGFLQVLHETLLARDGCLETDLYMAQTLGEQVRVSRWVAVYDLDQEGIIQRPTRQERLFKEDTFPY